MVSDSGGGIGDNGRGAAKTRKRIVIVGGGFAGVECARQLESELGDDPGIDLVMINEDNFLLFTPMLPQVVSGMIETRHIVTPIRTICKRTRFFEGRVKGIDPYAKTITVWGGGGAGRLTIHYDFAVVALGSEANFFGMPDVESNAFTMKTLNDAAELRNRVIDMLERAENETDPVLRRHLLNFVVVGAGFAGIETAGELMDLLHDAHRHYRSVGKDDVKVVILEALQEILPGFDKNLAAFAKKRMEGRGIEFRLQSAVKAFDGEEITVRNLAGGSDSGGGPEEEEENGDGDDGDEVIMSKTLIWTAGVTPVNMIKRAMLKTQKGKVIVDDYLEVPGFPGVFAVGDCALFVDPNTGRPVPPTAQLAEAQGKTAAKNLTALIKNREKEKFEFKSRGQMAVIGKRSAIASVFGMNMSGFWAWLIWRSVYLSKISSGEKKIRVLLDWMIDLFFSRDISRLKLARRETEKDYRVLDEVDDMW